MQGQAVDDLAFDELLTIDTVNQDRGPFHSLLQAPSRHFVRPEQDKLETLKCFDPW